jgi:hypothetical protein
MKRLLLICACTAACSASSSKPILDGGLDAGDGGACAATALRPPARKDVDAVLVPSTRQVYLFGGDEAPFDPTAAVPVRQLVADVWRLTLGACPTWEMLPASAAGARAGYAAVLDSKRGRILYIGGYAGTDASPPLVNDVWALDVATLAWSQLQPGGTPPSPRVGHRAVYDALLDRVLVFGGTASRLSGPVVGDLLTLSFSTNADGVWTTLTASGAPGAPPARYDAAWSIDPVRKVAVAFGGAASFDSFFNDVWLFDLVGGAWRQAAVGGAAPSQRLESKAAYDAARDRTWLFGGHDLGMLGLRNDTWTLALDAGATTATFAQVLAGDTNLGVGNVDKSSPERRSKHGQVLLDDKLWVLAGASDCGELDDLWSLDLKAPTAWTPVEPATLGETCARRAAPGQQCPSDCGAPF